VLALNLIPALREGEKRPDAAMAHKHKAVEAVACTQGTAVPYVVIFFWRGKTVMTLCDIHNLFKTFRHLSWSAQEIINNHNPCALINCPGNHLLIDLLP